MEGSGWLWLFVAAGMVLLGVALFYASAIWRRRPRDPAVEGLRDAKTRENYRRGG
jgi:hypothetical protein